MATGSAASMLPNTGTDAKIALAVDLDETLIAADTLIEGAAVLVKRHPSYISGCCAGSQRGSTGSRRA